ncbi:MAG: flavin monoamine oxidase family protein [Carbonactinosporaceae bacterium]
MIDAVVVGAGLAGLVAAERLQGSGYHVVVLEARDRVGGRTRNEPVGDGHVVETGGQWVGPGQDRVLALLQRLGLATFPTHDEGEHVLELAGHRSRYSGDAPVRNPVVRYDMARTLRRLDRLAKDVPLDRPWAAPGAESLDGQTFEGWLERTARTRKARTYFQVATQAVFATEASRISLLHALFYIHSGGGFESLTATGGGAQQDRVVGGSQLIAERLAANLAIPVRLSEPVRWIARDTDTGGGPGAGTDGGRVVVGTDDEQYRARRCIVTVPPALASRITYRPELPADRDQLTQQMPHGAVVKCHAVYDEPFWRADGLSGQAVSDAGPVQVVFDNSPPGGSPGVLVAFLEGERAVTLARAQPVERRQAVLSCLTRFFGPRAAEPVTYLERDWTAEPWTRGCYGAHLPPGAWTLYGPALRAPVGPLHWAGSETAERWCGYMDGAVESGERAEDEVDRALRS